MPSAASAVALGSVGASESKSRAAATGARAGTAAVVSVCGACGSSAATAGGGAATGVGSTRAARVSGGGADGAGGTSSGTLAIAGACVATRELRHQAPPSAIKATTSAATRANIQRGVSRRGAAYGTFEIPGTAPRCRSCSDLRNASRMNDTSILLDQRGSARNVEVCDERHLRARPDDAVDGEHALALVTPDGVLYRPIVERGS